MENSVTMLYLERHLEAARGLLIVVKIINHKLVWFHPNCKIAGGTEKHEEEIQIPFDKSKLAEHMVLHRIPGAMQGDRSTGRGKRGLE